MTEIEETRLAPFKARLGWALFQMGRDGAATLIFGFIFAPYFTNHVMSDPVRGQERWAFLMSLSCFIVAVLAPFAGAIADLAGRRKPWLAIMTLVMICATSSLWWALPEERGMSVLLISVIAVLYSIVNTLSQVFHDSMLPTLTPPSQMGRLSALGFVFDHIAVIFLLSFMLCVFMLPGTVDWSFIPKQALFGIDAVDFKSSRIVGPICAVWIFLLTLPFLRFTPDTPRNRDISISYAARQSVARVWSTLRDVRNHRNVATYLFARMLFNDGLAAVTIFSGIYAASVFKWNSLSLSLYGLAITSMVLISTYIGGFFDQHFGSKRTLSWGLIILSLGFLGILSFHRDSIFFFVHLPVVESSVPFSLLSEKLYLLVMGLCVLGAGPVLVSGRTLLARIAPPEKMSEFFGLFAFSGTATAFIGPFLVGVATRLFDDQRIGYASVLVLIGGGFIVLQFVKERRET